MMIREFLVLNDLKLACFFIDGKIYFLDSWCENFMNSDRDMDLPSTWTIVSKISGTAWT